MACHSIIPITTTRRHSNRKGVTTGRVLLPPPRLHLTYTLFSRRRENGVSHFAAILPKIGVITTGQKAEGFPRHSLGLLSSELDF